MSATDPETNVSSEDTPTAIPSAPVASPGDAPSDSIILIETGVVILMAVLPSLYVSIRDFYAVTSRSLTIYDNFIASLTKCAQVTIPVLFIIWRNGGRWSTFGIVPVKWLRDFLLMIAAFVVAILFAWGIRWGVYILLQHSQYRGFIWRRAIIFHGPQQPGDYLLLILLCCVIGFGEELIFRAYLIVRFERIFKSMSQAVFLSSVLFGAMHLYQGWNGAITDAAIGLIYALFFVRYRRLWPLAAAHAMMDFWAFARLH